VLGGWKTDTKYAKERQTFGSPIGARQGVAFALILLAGGGAAGGAAPMEMAAAATVPHGAAAPLGNEPTFTTNADKFFNTGLEKLLKEPYFLTSAWLRIDPTWKALRGNPRFEKLTGAKPVA